MLTAACGIRNFITGSLEKVLAPVLRRLFPICTLILVLYHLLAVFLWTFFSGLYSMTQQPVMGQGLLIIDDSRSHTVLSVGLLWTSDHLVAETSTWQHITLTRKTSMLLVGLDPSIPASERPQTHTSERAATGISVRSTDRNFVCISHITICATESAHPYAK